MEATAATKAKPAAKAEPVTDAEKNAQKQADRTRTPQEIASLAGAAPVDAVSGVHPPMAHVVDKDEAMVDAVVPRDFVLTGDDGRKYQFKAGVQPVPERLMGNWYVKANGVQPFADVAKSHKVVRDAEDEELRAKRAAEDAEIATRRAAEDRAEAEALMRERSANLSRQAAVAAGVDPAVAEKRAEQDAELAEKRADEDRKAAPTADVIAARQEQDAKIAAKRANEDAAAREKLLAKK